MRMIATWMHVCVTLLLMAVTMCMIIFVSIRFGGARVVLPILLSGITICTVMFVFCEMITKIIFRMERADPSQYPLFIECMEELHRTKWKIPPWMFRPRLYVFKLPDDLPNAIAFGWGFLGQYGVAVTPSLYSMLCKKFDDSEGTAALLHTLHPKEQVVFLSGRKPEDIRPCELARYLRKRCLKAVLAHEVGHIRSKDVGLMTVIALITGSCEALSKLFLGGKTAFGKGPIGLMIGGVIWMCAKVIYPIGRGAIMQEREHAADALSALYLNTPRPLMDALRQIQSALPVRDDEDDRSVLDSICISHPLTEYRLKALESYEQ